MNAEQFTQTFPDAAKPQETTLDEAKRIIYGDREKTYGSPDKNLTNIAQQWSLYIQQKFGVTVPLDCHDVCWMMVDLKKARQMNSPKRDNIVDAEGYLALSERIREESQS
jgi:hypothetical protein